MTESKAERSKTVVRYSVDLPISQREVLQSIADKRYTTTASEIRRSIDILLNADLLCDNAIKAVREGNIKREAGNTIVTIDDQEIDYKIIEFLHKFIHK